MALHEKSLVRFAQVARSTGDNAVSGGNMTSLFLAAGDETIATYKTAGAFNKFRGQLAVGDLILISATAGKGGVLVVTAVPATGNVTVADSALA